MLKLNDVYAFKAYTRYPIFVLLSPPVVPLIQNEPLCLHSKVIPVTYVKDSTGSDIVPAAL